MSGLFLVLIGAVLGMGAMLKGMQQYAEREAYASYLVGFRRGRAQGRSDKKRAGLVWVETGDQKVVEVER